MLGMHVRTRMFDWEADQVPDVRAPDFIACAEQAMAEIAAQSDGGGGGGGAAAEGGGGAGGQGGEGEHGESGDEGGGGGDWRIFLATPSEAVRRQVESAFGARLVLRPVEVDRLTMQGQVDAVVDLWLLGGR